MRIKLLWVVLEITASKRSDTPPVATTAAADTRPPVATTPAGDTSQTVPLSVLFDTAPMPDPLPAATTTTTARPARAAQVMWDVAFISSLLWWWIDRPERRRYHPLVTGGLLLGVLAIVNPGYLLFAVPAASAGAGIGYYPVWRAVLGRVWHETASRRREWAAAASRARRLTEAQLRDWVETARRCWRKTHDQLRDWVDTARVAWYLTEDRRREWAGAARGFARALGEALRKAIVSLLRWVAQTSRESHVLVGAAIALAVAHALWPHQFALIAAVLGVGVVLGYYPTWRSRPRSTLSRKMQVATTVEGLTAGAFKIPAAFPGLAIVRIAADAHTQIGWVDGGVFAISGVAYVTVWIAIRRVRANRTRPLGKRQVLMSFGGVVAGMLGFADAHNGLWLAASLAITGLGVATNERFRNVIQAQFQDAAAREFQIQTNIWTRRVTAIGLPLLAVVMVATPLGWRGTAVVIAVAFVVLAVLSVTVRQIPGEDHQKAQDDVPDDVSRLPSLAKVLMSAWVVIATATIWKLALEPGLVSIGVPVPSFWAAVVTFLGEVGTGGFQRRLQRPLHRTPREVGLRSSTLLLPAAVLGPLTMVTPWWWVGVAVAAAWIMLGEAAGTSIGSSMRTSASRLGTVAALKRANGFYLGQSVGALLAGLTFARTPLGLGLLLGSGAVLSVAVAAWVPRVPVTEEKWTWSPTSAAKKEPVPVTLRMVCSTLSVVTKKVGDDILAVVSNEHGYQGTFTMREAHQLRFRKRMRFGDEPEKQLGQAGRETYTVGRLTTWFGPPWWAINCVLWLTHATNRLSLLRPIAFALDGHFHGVLRWMARGTTRATVTHTHEEVRIDITLHQEEQEVQIEHLTPNDAADRWRIVTDHS